MTIIWTDLARRDLVDIRNWFLGTSPAAAREIARRIRSRIEALADFPQMGPVAFGEVRRLVVGHHLVFYLVEGDRVRIVRVWDSRRPLPEIIGEREAAYGSAA